MRHVLFIFASAPLCALVLALWAEPAQAESALDISRLVPTVGSGAVGRQVREVGHFRALAIGTDAKVIVRQGDHDTVEVEAEANVIDLIGTQVEGGTLTIEDRRHFRSPNAQVTVTVRRLRSLQTSGAAPVVAEGIAVPLLSLSLGGSSSVVLNALAVGQLRVASGGSSVLSASGAADGFSAALGGSSSVDAAALVAGAVSVDAGGSSQATVWATRSLALSLGGSSGVRYYGRVSPSLAAGGSATVKGLGDSPPSRP